MNDDPDKPLNPVGDDALEARLTAWVLGEASPFEAAELEELCAGNPEARLFVQRLRVLHGLIAADAKAGPEDEWKLPAEKRAKIEALFEEPVVVLKPEDREPGRVEVRYHRKPVPPRHSFGRRALLAVAACTVISVGGWALFTSIGESSREALAMQAKVDASVQRASRESQEAALEELRKAVKIQEDAVEDKRKLLSQIIRTEGIIYSGDHSVFQGSRGFNEADDAESAARAYVELEQNKIGLENQIESLLKYDGEQLMNYASGLDLPDNILPVLKPQLDEAKREYSALKDQGLAANDPKLQSSAKLVAGMEKDMMEAVGNVRKTLKAKLASSNQQLAQLQTRMDAREDDAIKKGIANQSFVDAKNDFETSQRLLEQLKLKQIEMEVRLKAGDSALAMSSQEPRSTDTRSAEMPSKAPASALPASPPAAASVIAGKASGNLETMGHLAEAATPADSSDPQVRFRSDASAPDRGGVAGGAITDGAVGSGSSDPFASGGAALTDASDSLDLFADAATGGLKQDFTLDGKSALSPGRTAFGLDALQRQKADPELAAAETAQAWFSQSEAERARFVSPPAVNLPQTREVRSKNEPGELADKPAEPERALADADPFAESPVELAAKDQTRAQLLAEVDKAWELEVPPLVPPSAPAQVEAKKQLEEAKPVVVEPVAETLTSAEPFSTFSLHVSDASFKLAKAALDRGEVPAAESIRPEEFYNAFDYGDPAPGHGEPVACAVEQSAHPALPQRNLLRIGVKTGSQGRGGSTPLNLTLLLDSSGSMEREDRTAGLANAVKQLSGLLKEGDTISVIGFARQPRLLADRLPGARAQELNAIIARTPSEGGTNLEEGLKLGEQLALRQFNPAAQNRVVLFTDGAANLGDAMPETLQAKVEQMRQQGIAFDAAGFGADGLNDQLLERLTRNGNGRYYIVDDAADADANFAKQLAGAFRPAAENVKVQVRFNPARVAKYKLIGFEEHRLNKEDFRNDTVDAAEMAAEEAGNALYQIEALPLGEGEVGEVSVRFRDAASGQMVERTWTIPYEAQAPAFDQAKPSLQLAGLAAFAAEKLRAAPLADAVDFQQLAPVLAKVKARYPNSRPVAELEAMIGKLK